MLKTFLSVNILLLLITANVFSQSTDERIQKGIDYIYHLKFDSAQTEFREVINLEPQNPAGYFFEAAIDWWKINLNKENDSMDEKFFEKVEKVVEVADNRLEKK